MPESMLWVTLASVLTGGFLAVIGSFLAQRYQHRLGDRSIHHEKLKTDVLDPWLAEASRQRSTLDTESWQSIMEVDWRGGFSYSFAWRRETLDPQSGLVLRARVHWPGLAGKWQAIQERLLRFEVNVDTFMDHVFAKLPEPPGGTWAYEHPWDRDFPKRSAAVHAWRAYWQSPLDNERAQSIGFKRILARESFWAPDAKAQEQLLYLAAHDHFFSPATQLEVESLKEEARRLVRDMRDFEAVLEVLLHDRNLAHRCRLCLSLWPRVDVRGRMLWIVYRVQAVTRLARKRRSRVTPAIDGDPHR